MSGVAGKVALVTGSSRGVGRAIVEALLQNGALGVCVTDVFSQGHKTAAELNKKYGKGKALFVNADVCEKDQQDASFQRCLRMYGQLDIVGINAGIIDEKNYSRMVDINLKAMMTGTYMAYNYMSKDKGGNGGVIINTASIAVLCPFDIVPGYTATKFGVVGFISTLTSKRAPPQFSRDRTGVRICAVCPDYMSTTTQYEESDWPNFEWAQHARKTLQYFNHEYPVALPEQMAQSFIHLAEDESLHGAFLVSRKMGERLVRPCYDFKDIDAMFHVEKKKVGTSA